jgi:DedD protein
MPTRTDSNLAVDELKRRARRRLVGAVVLALAAAVILPLLLESDPKPLGDDVSIRIPPVDDGRFVNPLSPDKTTGATGTSDAKSGLSTPRKSIGEAERRVLGQPKMPLAPMPPLPAAVPDAAPAPSPPNAATVAAPANFDPAAKGDPPARSEAVTTAEAPAKGDATGKTTVPARAAGDPAAAFSVQVGAFVDAKAAADLAETLKRGGFPAYTEGVATTQGTVQRVRVGPFATRAAADAGLAKLKAAGYASAEMKSPK